MNNTSELMDDFNDYESVQSLYLGIDPDEPDDTAEFIREIEAERDDYE